MENKDIDQEITKGLLTFTEEVEKTSVRLVKKENQRNKDNSLTLRYYYLK